MLLLGVTVDKHIIKICNTEIVEVLLQYLVYISLEGGRDVRETERENGVLKQPEARDESCVFFVSFPYTKFIEGADDVDFGEPSSFEDSGEEITDERRGIPVLDSDFIQSSVIDTDPNAAPWFAGDK